MGLHICLYCLLSRFLSAAQESFIKDSPQESKREETEEFYDGPVDGEFYSVNYEVTY